jgi:hypothetical protein
LNYERQLKEIRSCFSQKDVLIYAGRVYGYIPNEPCGEKDLKATNGDVLRGSQSYFTTIKDEAIRERNFPLTEELKNVYQQRIVSFFSYFRPS